MGLRRLIESQLSRRKYVKGKKETRGTAKQKVALMSKGTEMNKINARNDSTCKGKGIKTKLTRNMTLRDRQRVDE